MVKCVDDIRESLTRDIHKPREDIGRALSHAPDSLAEVARMHALVISEAFCNSSSVAIPSGGG